MTVSTGDEKRFCPVGAASQIGLNLASFMAVPKLTPWLAAAIVAASLFSAPAAGAGDAVPEKTGRHELQLAGSGWKVWLDDQAQWQNDKLYAPDEVDLKALPVNPPTGGWQALDSHGAPCTIPASVEEIFSGGVNSYCYLGVSWFWKEVLIPADWQGKRVNLHIDKARMRTEVYVNGKLAGYDVVSEIPLDFDLTNHLVFGKPNQIAIRLTNPGGNRGWEDAPQGNPPQTLRWGNYDLPMSHNFSGIGGDVTLTARDPVFIEDLFVKNTLPAGARNAEIYVTVRNTTGIDQKVSLTASIEEKGLEPLLKTSWEVLAKANSDTVSVWAVSVPKAKLWSVETPNLYKCQVMIEAPGIRDEAIATIGFRVFEVAGDNFYLNGKRVRIRSSIDWGYYALTGFYATPEMARRSVENAKAIGHNGINFHRQIGEPLVMEAADELGLYLYEEPGGFHDYPHLNYRVIDQGCSGVPVARMAEGDDPAPGVVKTLTVKYRVGDRSLTFTGTDPDPLQLAVSAQPEIKIEEAAYGVPGDAARLRNVTAKLQNVINRGESGVPVARMAEGDDPAPGVVKTLTVKYRVGDRSLTFTGTDPDPLQLAVSARPEIKSAQPEIKIEEAAYGVPGDAARLRNVTAKLQNVINGSFAGKLMEEKCRQMFLRDRNHPSLLMFCLANESNTWGPLRERVMRMAADLDGSRLVINTSGSNAFGGGDIWHIRPYETEIRKDYWDDHTVESKGRFQESDLLAHQEVLPGRVQYFGEVRCYTGPDNSPEIVAMKSRLPDGRPGYDLNVFAPMAGEIESYFNEFHVASIGSGNIKTPSDVSRQAGRGLMYIDGRLGQALLRNDASDGYAISGWSGGGYLPGIWASAICDEGRNLKGPAEDFAYWTRDVQIAITRKNGKYFQPGQSAEFDLSLINEGKLPAGDYVLKISVRDGAGNPTGFTSERPVKVAGADRYAQPLGDLKVPVDASWRGGYLTIQGELLNSSGRRVADGAEQVLLKNRASFRDDLKDLTGAVVNWPAAQKALTEAGVALEENLGISKKLDFIAAGDPPESGFDQILKRVKSGGSLLLIRFDAKWADLLLQKGLLSEPVTGWGGEQTHGWDGNGWGYLDHFVGDQSIPSGKTIGTTSWEVPGDPMGFAPFKSSYKLGAYGAYLARPNVLRVLIGTMDYGKGKIILSPAYPVDSDNAFNDLLFFNIIRMGSAEKRVTH